MLRVSSIVDSVNERRREDSIQALERRLIPRSVYANVDFGAGGTSATSALTGLTWLTSSMVGICTPTTSTQVAAGLEVFSVDLVPGKGFTLVARSSSSLVGPQRVGVIVI